jgi:hypothetical protein
MVSPVSVNSQGAAYNTSKWSITTYIPDVEEGTFFNVMGGNLLY